jgi:hypothetical protein
VEINISQVVADGGAAAMRRSMSFGSLTPSLSINDFNVIKVLGKGRLVVVQFLSFTIF